MPLHPYRGVLPKLGEGVFLAPTAYLTGDIEVGDLCSFWYHTVARGDVSTIRIGRETNVQDGCVLHVNGGFPLVVGERVTVGHQAVLHGCTVEDDCLIGIGAQILDGAVVEAGAQVAAGALVAPGKRVPAGHLVMGFPAKVVRALTDEDLARNRENNQRYVTLRAEYLDAG